MRFVTAILHPVENLDRASDFFCTALGFSVQNQCAYGALLENGAVTIRLVAETTSPQVPLHLELYSKNLTDDTQALLKFPEILLLTENSQKNSYRIESCLQAPHGVMLTLYQEFNEDEVNLVPDLPICLDWENQAVACLQALLKYVPIEFRQLARTRVTERAEVLAAEHGEITVTLEIAVQALAESTPHFQHPTLVAALHERGIATGTHFHLPES